METLGGGKWEDGEARAPGVAGSILGLAEQGKEARKIWKDLLMKLLMSREWIISPHEKSNLKMEKTEKPARGICLQLTCQLLEKDGSQRMESGGGEEQETLVEVEGPGLSPSSSSSRSLKSSLNNEPLAEPGMPAYFCHTHLCNLFKGSKMPS